MVSITLSIPEDVKRKMEKYPEINWSGFVRSAIEQKVKKLAWKEQMTAKLREEQDFNDWTVEFGRTVKKEAFDRIKKEEGI